MLLAVCGAVLAGCGGQKESGPAGPGLVREVERGPHAVVLRLDRLNPTVADRVNLQLEVTGEEDWKVTWPVVKGTLDQFQVVDQDEDRPVLLPDGRTKKVRTYVLEPFLPGTYTIPALEFRLEKRGEATQTLATEAVPVEVRSVLPEGAEGKIRDIVPPVSLREKWGWGWLWWGGGILAAAAAAAWWWRCRDQRRAVEGAVPRRPAHELALEELEALRSLDLPGQGQAKRFFQELSAILRRYVENRFGVHAPGQTTEEFLIYQSRSGAFDERHQALLKGFLQHCDLVKFAELAAGPDQARQAFEVCRSFVWETRLVAEAVEEAV